MVGWLKQNDRNWIPDIGQAASCRLVPILHKRPAQWWDD